MRSIFLSTLLLALLIAPASLAQEPAEKLRITERAHSLKIDFSSTDQLRAEGWEEVEPEVWRKTFDNGVTSEIALGAVAYERTRERLDHQIAALEAQDELDAEQELKLFELLLRREELDNPRLSIKRSGSETLCTGTATFQHDFGWLNFAYPYADSSASYQSWFSVGTATAYTEALLCAGNCVGDTASDVLDGWGSVTVTAPASGIPTWTCWATTFSSVKLTNVNPYCGDTVATFSSFWSC